MNKYKSIAVPTLAFAVPIALIVAVYAMFGFAPFGDKSLLLMDMWQQYIDFYASLFNESTSLFFSWDKSMGTGYISLFSYYLSSPFSFIVLLFPKEDILFSIFLINILKLASCGLTLSIFLKNRFGEWNYSYIVFAVCYALMSYNICYSMCLMWIDGMIWLPIVLLGIDKVIKKEKIFWLVFSFAVLLISNYYTAYMVLVFAVIYFLVRVFGEEKVAKFPKKLGLCALSAVISGALSAFLTVPSFLALLNGRLETAQTSVALYSIKDFTLSMLPTNYDTIKNEGVPLIFCGTLILFLVICFFLNKQFTLKHKIICFAVIGFLGISTINLSMYRVWHMGQITNWFPTRFAFVISFFLIYVAVHSFLNIKSLSIGKIAISAFLTIAFYATAFVAEKEFSIFSLAIAFATVLLFAVVSYLVKFQKLRIVPLVAMLLFVCIEMSYNAYFLLNGLHEEFVYKTTAQYEDYYENVQPIVDKINELSGDEFYRAEKDFQRSHNDAMGLGYHGITHYSSTYLETTNEMLDSLGNYQTHIWNAYTGINPVTDALFSVKYLMLKDDVWHEYELIEEINGISLYENPYTIPLVTVANGFNDFTLGEDPFENQENMLKGIIDYDGEVWADVIDLDDFGTVSEHGTVRKISFTVAKSGPVYVHFNTYLNNYVNINGVQIEIENSDISFIGEYQTGDYVELTFSNSETFSVYDLYVSSLDEEKFKSVIADINSNETKITDYSAGKVNVNIVNENDGFLYTSIPYDSSWSCYIDGEKVDNKMFGGAFLSIDLPEGEYSLEMVYVPQGFNIGLAISITALVAILAYFIYFKLIKKH